MGKGPQRRRGDNHEVFRQNYPLPEKVREVEPFSPLCTACRDTKVLANGAELDRCHFCS